MASRSKYAQLRKNEKGEIEMVLNKDGKEETTIVYNHDTRTLTIGGEVTAVYKSPKFKTLGQFEVWSGKYYYDHFKK